MTTTEPRPETEAEKARALAEARKFDAEARKAEAEAVAAEHAAAQARILLDSARRQDERQRWADAYGDHVYRFIDGVSGQSAVKCIDQLNAWHREDPTCSLTILFDSPGGAVVPGFHLYDHVLELREQGHHVTTVTRGMAASMGGILLQSGDERVMGPNAVVLIHEVSFSAIGKIGEVEDTVDLGKMLWNRALDIFAERCQATDAPRKLTRRQLERRSNRKDWWIKAADALAYGLVDAVR